MYSGIIFLTKKKKKTLNKSVINYLPTCNLPSRSIKFFWHLVKFLFPKKLVLNIFKLTQTAIYQKLLKLYSWIFDWFWHCVIVNFTFSGRISILIAEYCFLLLFPEYLRNSTRQKISPQFALWIHLWRLLFGDFLGPNY